ncbi:MAG: DNA internalization-related competence protein ComEC/Rec2 [Balneolaceae bacterium]
MNPDTTYSLPIAKYPAVRLAALFIMGILLAHKIEVSSQLSTAIFGGILLLFSLNELYLKRKISIVLPKVATVLFFILVVGIGFIRTKIEQGKGLKAVEQLLSVSPWQEITLAGQVQEITENSRGKTRLNITTTAIEFESGLTVEDKFKTRVLWDIGDEISMGDYIKIQATIIPISGKRNPHSFDYKQYLASKGMYSQVRADSLMERTSSTKIISWLMLREKALKLINHNFDEETAPIAKALLLGYKNELEGETKAAFARAGLSHIMAVSGLHVGLVVAPFWLVIPYFWTRKYGTHIGLAILIGILFFYAGITGFSASVLRASVMAVALTYGKLFSKRGDSINLTAVAALTILLFNPNQLFEIGFQLSFAAVLIILLIMPVIQAKLPYWLRVRWYSTPLMVMIISIVVQFGLYPLQVYYFGEVSLISPLANALFVPLLGVVVPLSLLSIFISILSPSVGFIVNYPTLLFLKTLHNFVNFTSTLDWAWMKSSLSSNLFFGFWLALVFTIASWRSTKVRYKWLSVTLCMIIVMQIEGIYTKLTPPKMVVIVFDVGQGDANLITTPNKKHILIDAGIWSPSTNSGEQVLLPYFKSVGINKLDAVILTHPHADHIGGIVSLLDGIEIETIYNSGYKYDSNLYKTYLEKAEEKGVEVRSVLKGEILEIDPAVLFLVMGPDESEHGSDPNQHSIILNVIYGENKFLFTGDAGKEQELRLVKQYGNFLNTDFLKVGHHGSRTSSDSYFLQHVTPQISTVSLADKNRFKHPHQEAIRRLAESGTNLYFTSRDKGLVFESDGVVITQKMWQ